MSGMKAGRGIIVQLVAQGPYRNQGSGGQVEGATACAVQGAHDLRRHDSSRLRIRGAPPLGPGVMYLILEPGITGRHVRSHNVCPTLSCAAGCAAGCRWQI